jgi:hypothetical protein
MKGSGQSYTIIDKKRNIGIFYYGEAKGGFATVNVNVNNFTFVFRDTNGNELFKKIFYPHN